VTSKPLSCTTTDTAFVDWAVASRQALASATYLRLVEGGDAEFEPTPAFFDRLGTAVEDAFAERAGPSLVPAPVEAAVVDAVPATAHEFLDRPDADLREEVLPAFLDRVARYTCTSPGE